jgi:hypothetical protein
LLSGQKKLGFTSSGGVWQQKTPESRQSILTSPLQQLNEGTGSRLCLIDVN